MGILQKPFSLVVALSLVFLSSYAGKIQENGPTKIGNREPPKEPILRVDSGMHIAPIMSLAVDSTNQFVITGSIDKTIRVWQASDGRLLKTIRPPISDGREGMINALALSPDGSTIAAGGWTGEQWDNSFCIYFFDRETGRFLKRITGLQNAVFYLAYSTDGSRLVATMGERSGIRVYRTGDLSLIAEDHEYDSFSKGAAFDHQGRLVTTAWDGYIRLYDRNFSLLAKVKIPALNQPYGVSFSSDGTKIAVGYEDLPKVVVLSGQDLSVLYSPDTSGMTWGSRSVTWSVDGHHLYAGGTSGGSKTRLSKDIRRWLDAGKGLYEDFPVATDTITSIKPLAQGGIIYGAADSNIGVIDAKGRHRVLVGSLNTDYRSNWSGFVLSEDASVVQFSYKPFNQMPARFSVLSRQLDQMPNPDNQLAPPLTSTSQIKILNWENTISPTLNNHRIQLEPFEVSRSAAVSSDSFHAVFGTEWKLRLYGKSGQLVWNVPIPGSAWTVNIAKNNRLVVAALADGTIRWYRLRDGQELLALFPHFDKKRWVLWTPSGYFDASPGAEDLLGWQRNNGDNSEADFFPVGKFRSVYYRPDVIAKILDTLDEGAAVRLANAEAGRSPPKRSLEGQLPPVVTILSPASNIEVSIPEVVVRISVRSPSGEVVTGIKILVDGRPTVLRGVTITLNPKHGEVGEETKDIRIPIPERDVEISVIAENRFSASDPATVGIRWRGTSQKNEFTIKPKLYVLAIGVSQYANKDLALGFAAKDAQDFAAALKSQQGGLYREVTTKVLTNEKASRDEISDGLDWITKETTSKDVAMVFLAGHGVNDPHGIYYFLPVNADPEKLKRTSVSFSDIKNTVASLAGKALFFVDTCHSGNVMGTRRGITDITRVVNELTSAENGVVVFAASTGNQYSLEDPAWSNGAFTKALVEGINGKADYTGKGKISINMLDLYISERVKELTQGKQTPTTTKPQTIPDFPIALRQ